MSDRLADALELLGYAKAKTYHQANLVRAISSFAGLQGDTELESQCECEWERLRAAAEVHRPKEKRMNMNNFINNFKIVFDPNASYAEKVEVISQIHKEELFVSRYNQLKAMEGKKLAELPSDDAELVHLYIRNQDPEYRTTLYSNYLVSVVDGVVQVQMRDPGEIVDELVDRFKTWEIFQRVEEALVEAIAKMI